MIKKNYLFTLLTLPALLCLGTPNAWGDSYTKTCSNGDDLSQYAPVYGVKASNYIFTQIIYPSSELTAKSSTSPSIKDYQITKMTFYVSSTNKPTNTWSNMQVRLKEITQTSFSSNTDWQDYSDATLVYDGILDATSGTMVINFTTPYVYKGGQLLVDVRSTAKNSNSAKCKFYAYYNWTTTQNTVLWDYNSTSSYYGGTRDSYRPKVTFTYEDAGPSCADPTSVTASVASATSATVEWTDDAASEWQVRTSSDGGTSWSDPVAATTNPYTLSGLTEGTTYNVQVRAKCDEELFSEWVDAASTVTPVSCPSVTAVTLSNKLYNSVTVNWTLNGATNCDVRYKEADDADWTSVGTGISATTKTISGLVPGGTYTFEVKSSCGETWVAAGENYAPVWPTPGIPSVSSILDATASASWTAATDADGYEYVVMNGTDAANWTSATAVNALTASLTGLAGATNYTVYVRAKYGEARSAEVSANFTTICIAPTNLEKGEVTYTTAHFSWSQGSADNQYQYVLMEGTSAATWQSGTTLEAGVREVTVDVESGNNYTFYVRSVYGSSYSSALSENFNTPCPPKVSLPYICGFESTDEDPFASNGSYNPCWKRIGSPAASNSASFKHNGSKSLRFGETGEQYAILPEFEQAVKGMQITFWYRNYWPTSYASTLTLGTMTDPTDASTFTPIKVLDAINSYAEVKEESLAGAGASDHYIAFKYTGSHQYSAVYLDDIKVELLPSCPKPTAVVVSNVTGTTADISWSSSASAWKLQYSTDGTNWTDVNGGNNITDKPYTLEGLTPNHTTYYVRVKADCGGGDLSDWSNPSEAFQTECADITIDADHEWTEDFNNQTANQLPACWSAAGNTTAVYVVSSSSYLTITSKVLYFSGGSGSEAIAILPDITTDVNTLQIAFSHVEESKTSSGKVRFGYYKDAAFTALKTCDYSNSSSVWKDEAAFAITGVPSDAKLAFAYKPNYSGYTAAVDNIVISLAASCAVPSEVVGDGLSTSTASISWTAGAEETAWKLQYSTDGENWTDANEGNNITTNPYELTGLSAGTTYYVRVKADCGGDLSDWSATSAGFKTDCDAQAMPFEEAFGSTLPECWKMVTVGDNSWVASSSSYYRHSASYSWSYSAYTSADNYSDLITPAIILDEDALLKFYVSNYAYSGTNVVAEVYIQYGSTTEKIFDIPTISAGYTPEQQVVDLSEYTGKTAKFIFRAHGNGKTSYKYIYIDDVEVKAKPCDAPTAVNVTASSSDATITWTDETNDKWNLRWHEVTEPANDEWTVVENLDAKSYTISSGLEVGKTYEVQVQSVCPAKTSTWYPTPAKTFELVCSAPTALAVTARTTNSATFSWTSSETSWVLQYTTDGENWESENVTVNPFTLEGLAAGTTYQAKIQAACGSAFSNVVEFTTWCGLAEADELPLNEDFSAGVKPACWEFISDTEYPVVINEKIWFQGENEQIVMLPGYNINLNQLHVSFDFTASNASIELGYYAANGGAFQSLGAVTSGADVDLSTTSAPAAAGYLAIRYYDATASYSTGSVDNIHVTRQLVLADGDDNSGTLAANNGKTLDVQIGRTIVCADYYNTLCLPFSLPTLDGTPLEGGDIWAFKYAKVDESTGELLFRIVEAESIEAGKPYFIAFPSGDPIVNPFFKNVTISATVGQNVGNEEVAQLCGIVDQPVEFKAGDQTKLFLAANNTFYWWNGDTDSRMNAFRAYFKVSTTTSGPSYVPRHGMRARIIKEEQVATGIEDVQGTTVQSTKLLENSQVVIIRNGVKYNLQGQVIK